MSDIPQAAAPAPAEDMHAVLEYIRAELDQIAFGITSGVNNGVERAQSLKRYVESKM